LAGKKKRKVRASSCKHHGAGSKQQAPSHKRLTIDSGYCRIEKTNRKTNMYTIKELKEHWRTCYGEDLIAEYPAFIKLLIMNEKRTEEFDAKKD